LTARRNASIWVSGAPEVERWTARGAAPEAGPRPKSSKSGMNDHIHGLPPPEQPDDAAPVSTLLLIGGLVIAALVFVVAGLGFVLGWWGPDAQADPVAQAEVVEVAAATGEPEAIALPGAELMPTADARPSPRALEAVDPLSGAEPVPEIPPPGGRNSGSTKASETATTSGTSSGTSSADGSKPKLARVRVQFMLGHYEHVELKLGGKVFELDDDRTIELPAGGYRVELRKAPELPWKPAGLIELQLGKRYRVTLFDPPLTKLEVVQ
jgi:hypothetical protein